MDGRAGEGGGERARAQLAQICQSNEYCYELSTLNLRLLPLLVTLKTVIKVVSLILKHVFLLRFSGWIRDVDGLHLHYIHLEKYVKVFDTFTEAKSKASKTDRHDK